MVPIIIYMPSYRKSHFSNSCGLFCWVQMVFSVYIFLFNNTKYEYRSRASLSFFLLKKTYCIIEWVIQRAFHVFYYVSAKRHLDNAIFGIKHFNKIQNVEIKTSALLYQNFVVL